MTAETHQTRRTSTVASGRAPAPIATSAERGHSLVEARFYFGLAGLFISSTVIWLALWTVVPALVGGWSSVVITSGSMNPSVAPGDVITASPHDGQGLGPGTVVVFRDAVRSDLVTHRIVSVNEDGTYLTKGDANTRNDSTPLAPEQVVGVGRLLVPLIGLPALWAWTGAWLNLCVWAVLMILAVWSARFALLDRYDPWFAGDKGQFSGLPRHRRTARILHQYRGRHRAPSLLSRRERGVSDAYA